MPRRPRAEYEITALDKTQKAFTSVHSSIERTTQKFRAVGGVAAAVTSGAFGAFAAHALNNAKELNRMSQALDINVEKAQRLEVAFRRFGLQSDDVSDAINTLTDRAEDAKDGMQSFIDDFRLIGLEVDDLRDKKPAELFDLFADAVENTEDANKRNSAVVRILGDDLGNRLLPALKRGSQGFRELGDEAERAGRIMSEQQVKSTVEAERSIDRLIQTIKDRGEITFANWADTINNVATAMNAVVDASRNIESSIPGPLEILEGAYRSGQDFGRTLRGEGQTVRGTVDRSGLNLSGLIDQATTPRSPQGADLLVTRPNAEQLGGKPLPRERFFNDPLGFNRLSMDEQIRQRQQRQLFDFNSPLSMQQQADTLQGAQGGQLQSPSQAMLQAMREDGDEIIDIQERIKERELKIAEERKAAQQDLASFKKRSEQDIVDTSLALAKTLAQGNEDVSKAIFAVEKGLNIAEIIMNTQTAAMRALAELGPVAGPPAAASIETLGYTKAALVGALGIAQATTSGQGGGSSGGRISGGSSSGNSQANQDVPDLSQERQQQVIEPNTRIIIQGDVYDSEKLAENLARVVGENDIELIPRNSRNAREIRRS